VGNFYSLKWVKFILPLTPIKILSAYKTYIKVKGIKHYVWIIMDACKKSILGYQVSDTRAIGHAF